MMLAAALALLSTTVAHARPDPYAERAQDLLLVLKEQANPQDIFAPSFLAQVPAEQIAAITRKLSEQNGQPSSIERIVRTGGDAGVVHIGYPKSIVHIDMVLERDAPFRIIGLLISSITPRDDSILMLSQEFAKLPGKAALIVTPLDALGAAPLIAHNADQQMAVASGFKLWLLAEASRQVRSGKRKWSDVITLADRSLPSGITQSWPRRSPITLHSAVTLAISISDNTAADSLLFALGRREVNAMVERAGHSQSNLPVLTTLEAFALKMDSAADLRAAWRNSNAERRLALLSQNSLRLGLNAIDDRQLAGKPRFIDEIEWFASPVDMARTLDWIRINGDAETKAILSVNKGIAKGDAARFRYLGYKGGSEIGVIAMNFLVQSPNGTWYAVCGAWNNAAATVDEQIFLSLMNRALALIPKE